MRVTVFIRDGLIARYARIEQAREHPAHEIIRIDLRHVGAARVAQVDLQLLVEERLAIVERFRVVLGAADQFLLVFFVGLDVQDQGVVGQHLDRRRIVEFAQRAAGVVDEVPVAVDLAGLADEFRHVAHGRDLRLPVQLLAVLEFLEAETALFRVAELAEEARHRLEIVHGDVVADVDRVRAQQLAQERHLHRLLLDVVEDRLVQIARADAVVARIMEPVALAQPRGQARLAHPGHAEQGDALVVPGLEVFGA